MIECDPLTFRYPDDTFSLEIPGISIRKAETVAVVGPSGCGKTTLLKLLCGILRPSSGKIRIGDEEISTLSGDEVQSFRIRNIGLVPQQFELLDYLTVKDNVILPYHIDGGLRMTSEIDDRAESLMNRVGVARHRNRFPDQLSQGERQRTAICRGLITSPKVILADEPTGNLDPENQANTVDLLLEQAREIEATVVMVTHEPSLLPLFEQTIDLLELRKKP